jgi:hypothetical protein
MEIIKGCLKITNRKKSDYNKDSLISEICSLVNEKKYQDILIDTLKNNKFKYDISKWDF